ncbi:MAG: 30S ribosomal protein S5 [Nanoarchaeota archaeon]
MEDKVDVVAVAEEPGEVLEDVRQKKDFDVGGWKPKTHLGKLVKEGRIDLDWILDQGMRMLESEIVDILLPNSTVDLLFIGQSKGKFGGGQKRVFKQTQKKTQEGNKPKFATIAVVGSRNGYVGIGYGKSKETVPAREKAIRNAKLSVIKIKRGCGSWFCGCKEPHSIPFTVKGKCGSVIIELIPAPKGTGLCVENECKKVLGFAGIRDVWSKSFGQTRSKYNMLYACFSALKQLSMMKCQEDVGHLGIVAGGVK